jgi:hypothetical protein
VFCQFVCERCDEESPLFKSSLEKYGKETLPKHWRMRAIKGKDYHFCPECAEICMSMQMEGHDGC